MAVMTRAAGPTRSGPVQQPLAPSTKRLSMSDIQTQITARANTYGLHAREGWGKTTLAGNMPKPFFLMAKGETGLTTLIRSNQLPMVPHLPEIQSWEELCDAVRLLSEEPHDYRTLVLDTMNGFEGLLYQYICDRDYDGDWGEKGFMSYQKGYGASMPELKRFYSLLDKLRDERKMTIFMLFHSKVETFKNPDGQDFDRWTPDMRKESWSITHKWLDTVLFGSFETIVAARKTNVEEILRKGKATSSVRVLYTTSGPSYDAKNRLGLPDVIDMEPDHSLPRQEGLRAVARFFLQQIRDSAAAPTASAPQAAAESEVPAAEVGAAN